MEKSYSQSKPEVFAYVEDVFVGRDAVLEEIVAATRRAGLPEIQVAAYDGLHLEVLTRACGAVKAVEIGTLGGYSAVCLARGLAEGGRLWTFEFDPKHAAVARQNFAQAGLADQIELIEGPALEGLKTIEAHGPFDVVFIDADKMNYPNYLTWAEKNLRVGGLVIGDNTFAFGHIAERNIADPELAKSVEALREFNQRLASSGKFRSTILPTGEGLTVGVKLAEK